MSTATATALTFDLPLNLGAGLNNRGHWSAASRRAKQERELTHWVTASENECATMNLLTRPGFDRDDHLMVDSISPFGPGRVSNDLGTRRGFVMPAWTPEEVELLRFAYSDLSKPVALAALAKVIGRDRHNVCRKARKLGLTNPNRPKVEECRHAREPKYSTEEERRAARVSAWKSWVQVHGHPRGMQGLKHTPESRARMSASQRAAWANPDNKLRSVELSQMRSDRMIERIANGEMNGGFSRARGGRREDLDNRYFRSAWEANYARYLNFLVAQKEIHDWEYECKTFTFDAIKRGTRAYTPDFKVTASDGTYEWHEVKGWMDQPSRTRLARMKKYYPKERVVVIDAEWFRAFNRSGMAAMIPNWESGTLR